MRKIAQNPLNIHQEPFHSKIAQNPLNIHQEPFHSKIAQNPLNIHQEPCHSIINLCHLTIRPIIVQFHSIMNLETLITIK